LFNASVKVGAPPDDFSVTGQNWGFPSYDWNAMEQEGYSWWKQRMEHMADYFDAYRIDHILGFFRMWEIPIHSVRGLLGQFNPALPYTVIELVEIGIDFKEEMTRPLFTVETLSTLFGENTGFVIATFLKKAHEGLYTLKAFCDTQQKICSWLNEHPKQKHLKEGLFTLCEEVLFLRDGTLIQGMSTSSKKGDPYEKDGISRLHPRIMGYNTHRFNLLSKAEQESYRSLHDDFFFRRQNDFWGQSARKKLKPLVEATRMLSCGEDLGMIPSCVPDVMRELQILSLEIQRMPKQQGARFENLNAIPYLSVCSPSTHDLNPLRAWWLENKETTTQYYQQVLWKPGVTPAECTPEIARDILLQHLESPAMWVVIPWQDWMAIDAVLRSQHPEAERINVPSNPRHYWRYRMHLTIGQLNASPFLTDTIRTLIKRTGRL
jgi:4-alpha-glucanotransferase